MSNVITENIKNLRTFNVGYDKYNNSAVDGGYSQEFLSDKIVYELGTVEELRAMQIAPEKVHLSGYHEAGDGAFGSNVFYRVDEDIDDNGGTILKNAGGVTYKLQYGQAMSNIINISYFGAKCDGETDCSDAISLVNSYVVSSGGNIVITSGGKTCVTRIGINFFNVNNIVVYRFNLKIKDDTPNTEEASGIIVHNVNVLRLYDSHFDLNRDNRTYGENIDSHAFNMRSCWNVSVRDCSFINSFQDGMYVNVDYDLGYEAISKNAVFDNCTFDNNWRQGVSLIAARNFVFQNCRFTNTNAPEDDNHEYAPEAGVDLESNSTNILNSIMDIEFISCDFSGNNGQGILIVETQMPKNINFLNSTVEFNKWSSIRVSGQNITFRDTKIKAGEIDGLYGLIRLNATEDMKNIHFYNTVITDLADGDYDGYYNNIEVKNDAGISFIDPSIIFSELKIDMNGASKWHWAQGGANGLVFDDVTIENSNLGTVHYYLSSTANGIKFKNIKLINSTGRLLYIDTSSNIELDGIYGYDLKEITDSQFIYIPSGSSNITVKNVKTKNIKNTDDIQMKALYVRAPLNELSGCDIYGFSETIVLSGDNDVSLGYYYNNFVNGSKFSPVGIDIVFKTNDDTPQNITVIDGVLTATEDA